MPHEPRGRRIRWAETWRIIASRFPPIDLFERVSSRAGVADALIELEQLTNPRLRDEIGEIRLVPEARRIVGPNSSYVMAAFTHINPKGSRFSAGAYGVYYAARALSTAIAETAYHFGRFASDSHDPPRREDMRVLLGAIDRTFDDVTTLSPAQMNAVLDKASYAASQPFGAQRRDVGVDGLYYPSVRESGGECIGAFWPDAVGIPTQERHLNYEWDGARVSRYFDYSVGDWFPLPSLS